MAFTTSTEPKRWDWVSISFMGSIHLLAILAFFFRPRLVDIALFFGFYLLTGFGITIGFHRLLAHRSFECPTWMMRVWAFLGTAALEGGPIRWVGIHRKHHQATDKEDDPHSPLVSRYKILGFIHSHFGWFCKQVGFVQNPAKPRDLLKDPFLLFLERGVNFFFPWLATVAICFALGGWKGVVWGGILRTIFVWHITWCVNSVCHIWGSRPIPTPDRSSNVWWVGILALGEGWHNYHHADPRAALHTHHWWEIDLSGYILRTMEKMHLIQKVARYRV